MKWTLYAMVEAEELGVTSKNVDQMKGSDNPNIKRLLGTEGEFGAALGLDGFDGRFDVWEVGKALSAALPAFEGVDLETVGAAGRALATAGESD